MGEEQEPESELELELGLGLGQRLGWEQEQGQELGPQGES